MSKTMRPVAIIGGKRTPFTKSFAHYSASSNKEMLTAVLQELTTEFNLNQKVLGEVAAGAVMKNSEDWNLTRESLLGTTLNAHTPAYDVQRACGTSLEAINQVALKIAAGQIDVGIGAGTDTNSDIAGVYPKDFSKILMSIGQNSSMVEKAKALMQLRPSHFKPRFASAVEPRTGLSMGDHCELMVKEWKIPRQSQDELAYQSHTKAAKAYIDGFYKDLIFNFRGLEVDTILRKDTTLEKLAKLKPAFDKTPQGTLTAGNSTALTDGAAGVLLASEEEAKKNGWPVLAHFIDAESSAVDFVHGEGLLMAPTIAVSRLLARNHLKLQDFDFYEIHEAFAGQVLCTLKAWESAEYCKKVLNLSTPLGSIDRTKMNVKGGSLALGHPFGATGARIVATLAKTLAEAGKGRALISICTAGGMGVAAILERP